MPTDILKGKEIKLPDGVDFEDKDGTTGTKIGILPIKKRKKTGDSLAK